MAEFQALTGLSEASAINAALDDSTTLVARVQRDAVGMSNQTSCEKYAGYGMDSSIVINEVDADQTGDDTAEFIELVNIRVAVGIGSLSLVITGADRVTEVLRLPLSGAMNAGEYLVVGTANVAVPFWVRKILLPMPSDNIPNDFYNISVVGSEGGVLFRSPSAVDRPVDSGPGTLCNNAPVAPYPEPSNLVQVCPTPTPGKPNAYR
jgi:hypothetical protein